MQRVNSQCLLLLALLLAISCLASTAPLALAQAGDTSVEGCIGCHALGEPAPVGRIESVVDLHYTDLDPKGPASASGYRQLNVLVASVDVTGSTTIVEFSVTDENGAGVPTVFASDGTLVVARAVFRGRRAAVSRCCISPTALVRLSVFSPVASG